MPAGNLHCRDQRARRTRAGFRVRFTDSLTGDYDLVVGADGIRSVVGELAFGKLEPAFAGRISWRSFAPFSLPGPPSIQFWLGDRCFFGLCAPPTVGSSAAGCPSLPG